MNCSDERTCFFNPKTYKYGSNLEFATLNIGIKEFGNK
jgi:hypothetical protein